MKIFLSWSGDRSRSIAEIMKKWLPFFIQAVNPWMSAEDIDKGTRWSSDIASHLEECSIGIICLTPENLEAPWIMFEAGALSKTIDKAFVCPLLFELDQSDLKGPLVQFQSTRLIANDFKKLIHTINKCMENKVNEVQLNKIFETWWPQIETELKALSLSKKESVPKRKDREILEEILALVRQQARDSDPLRLRKDLIMDVLARDPENEVITSSPKIRVYELAQKMGIDNSELIEKLNSIGVEVRNHMALLDEADINKLNTKDVAVKTTLIRRRPKL